MKSLNKFNFLIFSVVFFVSSNNYLKMNILLTEAKSKNDLQNFFVNSIQDIELIENKITKHTQEKLEEILKIKKEQKTYKNTIQALDDLDREIDVLMCKLYNAMYTHPKQEIVELCQQKTENLGKFLSEIFLNPELYQAATTVQKNVESEKESISDEQNYYLSKLLLDMKISGLCLEEEKLKEKLENDKKLIQVCSQFSQNIAKSSNSFTATEEELEGMSPEIKASLKKNGDLFVLETDYPTAFDVLENCENENTRKQMHKIFSNRAYPENVDVLQSMRVLKSKSAQMVGFNDYAQASLSTKMVGSAENAQKFIDDVYSSIEEKLEEEISLILQTVPKNISLNKDGKIDPWNVAYAKKKFEKTQLNLDKNLIKEYLPLKNVVQGTFETYKNLLDLKFETEDNFEEKWHESVQRITVWDQNNNLIGFVYLDLHPRKLKYTHACCMPIIGRTTTNNSAAMAVMICNFPSESKDFPSLLTHKDAVTFFHEFGHVMHQLMSKTEMYNFSGTSVLRDFVETPSQMFESWMWEPEVLKKVSCHYKTKAALPDDLIEKLIASQKLTIANWTARQIKYSRLSLNIFEEQFANLSVKELEEKAATSGKSISYYDKDSNTSTSFGHLDGYGAGYYGYLWSRVFAYDLFEQIKKFGLESEESKQLVKNMLKAGGSIHPQKLLKNLLKREPSIQAFKNFISGN